MEKQDRFNVVLLTKGTVALDNDEIIEQLVETDLCDFRGLLVEPVNHFDTKTKFIISNISSLFDTYGIIKGFFHLIYLRHLLLDILSSFKTDSFELYKKRFGGEDFWVKTADVNGQETQRILRKENTDLGVVFNHRYIQKDTFEVPKHGFLNIHQGKMPEYRGRQPAFWTLYENQDESAVTFHSIEEDIDKGNIIHTETFNLDPDITLDGLRQKNARKSAEGLENSLKKVQQGYEGEEQSATSRELRKHPSIGTLIRYYLRTRDRTVFGK